MVVRESLLFSWIDLVSDTFATQDLKRIHESHDGIILIPIVTKDGNAEQQTQE
jgi:exonuclease SbcD